MPETGGGCMGKHVALIAAVSLASFCAHAEPAAEIDALKARVQALESRLSELEARTAAPAPPVPQPEPAALEPPGPAHLDPARWDQLRQGMSMREVQLILGRPEIEEAINGGTLAVYGIYRVRGAALDPSGTVFYDGNGNLHAWRRVPPAPN